ncbi:hypothetical protein FUA24_16350 [Seonamhaeicola marinus]|uniref:Secreted protein n=2 Tax=Seonamhaeicola marinus TaxID=1912246 RepID=A0A5D0HUL9_9FLAO|nr:hypothetical protein FUA24_16350 [Seonamhaeicola marinus]
MIKQFIHKTFSVLLAVLVMFSTVSFTIEKHYCGDTLIDVAVFSETHKCGMEKVDHVKVEKKSCCKDEIQILEGQDELLKTFDDFDLDQQEFLISFVYTYINLFEGEPKQVVPHKDYSPPNLIKDVQVLDQVFLI